MRRRLIEGLFAGVAGAVALSVALSAAEGTVADAAMKGDVAAVRTLLKDGADVNAVQGDGVTGLHWAARLGAEDLASTLVDLSILLARSGRFVDAQGPTEDACRIYYHLAQAETGYLPDLAEALTVFAAVRAELNTDLRDAITAATQAVQIYERLSDPEYAGAHGEAAKVLKQLSRQRRRFPRRS